MNHPTTHVRGPMLSLDGAEFFHVVPTWLLGRFLSVHSPPAVGLSQLVVHLHISYMSTSILLQRVCGFKLNIPSACNSPFTMVVGLSSPAFNGGYHCFTWGSQSQMRFLPPAVARRLPHALGIGGCSVPSATSLGEAPWIVGQPVESGIPRHG